MSTSGHSVEKCERLVEYQKWLKRLALDMQIMRGLQKAYKNSSARPVYLPRL